MKSAPRYSIVPVLCALALRMALPGSEATATTDCKYHDAARFVHQWNWMLTDIMVDEIRTPCNISRVYAYANIAAYQAARPGFPKSRSLVGQINGLTEIPIADPILSYDWRVAAITAYKRVADALLFKLERSDSLYAAHMAELESGLAHDVIERSKQYGDSIAAMVLVCSASDGYIDNTAKGKYIIPTGPGLWEPTPPDFSEPVDPYWGSLHPFVMTSADQFRPDPPIPFSAEKGSPFYEQAMEVYNISRKLTEEQKVIPAFWDCNPIHSNYYGHFKFFTRQISPSGHWMFITANVAKKRNLGMMESLEAYTLVATSLAEAFLSCWTEKYHSNVIRPITYIQRYIDPAWQPLLQTPPFPEHTSGHSTISWAAATMLTHLFGVMPFDDDTEVYLGTPVRKFASFTAAAEEAALSRLYGGIHYRTSNEAGSKNGARIGEYIWNRVRTRA